MKAEEIFRSYGTELASVEQELLSIFSASASIIPLIGRHITNGGGKRIRPLMLLLSAELCGYKGPDRAYFGAIIEAIHTASLLHDDVIDEALTRRGKPSANSMWGNQVVILVGDYLYSNSLRLAVQKKNQKVMEALSEATTRMTEGEILQLAKTADPSITLEEYYKIVSAKTGVLIAAACRIGAVLAGASEEQERALGDFGLKTGIAFQLCDDVLDYVAEQNDLGKKLGKDLEEGKITLPMINLLKSVSGAEREELIDIIKQVCDEGDKEEANSRNLKRVIELFIKYDSITESMKTAEALITESLALLDIFPASPEREALMVMADYTMRRKR